MNFLVNAAFHDGNPELIRPETEDDRHRFKVEELKQHFNLDIANRGNIYDSRDIKSLSNNDLGLTLFLESNEWKVDSAMESLRHHCIWRKENAILDLSFKDIPREIHSTGLFMAKGLDKSGHPLFFIQLSINPGPKELHPLIIKQFLWQCETIRNCVLKSGKRLAIIFDCRNAQVDIGLLKEILDIYTRKYPPSAEYIAFLDMSFGFKMILQVIKYFFPKYLWKKMIFIDRDTLYSMVTPQNRPKYLDGTATQLTDEQLNSCPTLNNYVKANTIDEKVYDKMRNHLSKYVSIY